MMQKPRLVLMGTPAFAVAPFEAVYASGEFDIVGVVTQPDRPKGRGNKLLISPVKEWAAMRGLPVLQFERLRHKEGVAAMKALSPDLFVTAAFGQILSQRLLDIPRLGTVNLHASLLPAYRGAAPINWCIIMGETEAGVTTMMTDAGVDTGDMLLRAQTTVGPDETAGALTARLSALGSPLLVETLRRVTQGDCPRVKQDEAQASHQPMLMKEHGRINWAMGAGSIVNLVRGVDPWPGAWTETDGGTLKIWRAHVFTGEMGAITEGTAPGHVLLADAKRGLIVQTGDGLLELVEIQAQNAKRMAAKEYLRGHPMREGLVLGRETP